MKLYVANCSKAHRHLFVYRVIEGRDTITQVIEAGGQTQISGDHTAEGIDYIVSQHRLYGITAVDQIDRTRPYFGLAYSIDKPISADKLQRAIAHNDEALVQLGKEMRAGAAVTTNANAEQFSTDNRLPGIQNLEMTVVEERRDGLTPDVNEGIRVTDRGVPQAPAPTRGRRRAA